MFTLSDLPYAYNALEPYIDEKTMQIHHDKHHAAYVKNVNDALTGQDGWLAKPIEQVLSNLSKLSEDNRMKVRNNGGGHYNHTLFWEIMKPGGAKEPTGKLLAAINTSCGDFNSFKEHFSAKAVGRFGSGWAWLVKEKDGSVTITDTANQDSPIMDPAVVPLSIGIKAGKEVTPILALDVWEHAYYLKYQNLRADYIKAWWNVVNWTEVERRYSQ